MEKIKFKPKISSSPYLREGLKIYRRLSGAGYETYFTGGTVRDLILGREIKDIDLATSATPAEIKKIFSKFPRPPKGGRDRGRQGDLVATARGAAFLVMAIPTAVGDIEVATFRQDIGTRDHRWPARVKASSPERDAQRRDFTCNALFWDPKKLEITDYVGGFDDIQDKIIRFVGNPAKRIAEDYLRLLRAVRLAIELDFEIAEESLMAIRQYAPRIKSISKERITAELNRILISANRHRGVELLSDLGLLKTFLPEVEILKKIVQPLDTHPEGDVFVHTLLCLQHLENPTTPLAWAALLHDTGKAPTAKMRVVRGERRLTFWGHEKYSEKIAKKIVNRLQFSSKEKAEIVWLVGTHWTVPSEFPRMRPAKQIKLMQNPFFNNAWRLNYADLLAIRGKDQKRFLKEYFQSMERIAQLKTQYSAIPKTPKWLSGRLIMKTLELEPGPKVGRILEKLREAYWNGRVKNQESAIKWLLRQRK